jgi:hypothetical protein
MMTSVSEFAVPALRERYTEKTPYSSSSTVDETTEESASLLTPLCADT